MCVCVCRRSTQQAATPSNSYPYYSIEQQPSNNFFSKSNITKRNMSSYVVTGASRGLGYAWITYLASISPSNKVIAIVRNKSATEERLAKDGITNVHVLVADVTDHAAMKAAADATAAITGGGLDVLIHNAAMVSRESAYLTPADPTPQEFEDDLMESFRSNVVGSAHAVGAFLPLIRKGEVKKIVCTTSGMADDAMVETFELAIATPYTISKSSVNMLVAKYNAAIKSEGILIFALCPGLVDTSEGVPPSEEDLKFQQTMGGKFAEHAPHFKGELVPLRIDFICMLTFDVFC